MLKRLILVFKAYDDTSVQIDSGTFYTG